MKPDITEIFADLSEQYPGSKRTRKLVKEASPPPELVELAWDAVPYLKLVNGRTIEFFFIGSVAQVLGRSPNTVRSWIDKGYLPNAPFRIASRTANGQHRMWTRAQVEAILRVAQEEGILDGARVGSTEFTVRIREIFRQMKLAGEL